MAVEELQTRKQFLSDHVMPNVVAAMVIGFWVSLFVSALAFGIGLLLSTFQRSVGLSIVAFFIAFPISSKIVARYTWKLVMKDAETKTFKAE